MAFDIFLNFEKISLSIIENEIAQMTNENCDTDNDEFAEVDESKFVPNLYHGSIVATFIVNLYETTLNTILGRRLGCTETDIFKTSHEVKLQLICTMQKHSAMKNLLSLLSSQKKIHPSTSWYR